ncbi:carboxypeptidase-like regulatory domain-containing protein, partial [Vibrio vulnificus]|uniref:carboxypeptidase-like regulatory domain-containing protein n=1 Tax=Vibrio vulnificus TaxID=672 RepID=UPI001F514A6A
MVKGSTKGVATDLEGHYVITTEAGKKITLVFSYSGISKEVEDIEVAEDKVVYQDVVLERQAKTTQEVVVRSVSA